MSRIKFVIYGFFRIRSLRTYSFTFLIFLCLPALAQGTQNSYQSMHIPNTVTAHTSEISKIDHHLLEHLTKEEQHWYSKFQNGLLFFDGWRDISKEILLSLPHNEQHKIKKLLDVMGMRIGTEWSKSNDIRKIDTDQLRIWGDRLKQARLGGGEKLKNTVRVIFGEVDTILQHK